MNCKLYEEGVAVLRNEDNGEWISKIKCFKENKDKYNIYIFVVTIDNQEDLLNYYSTITAAIATEFQLQLEKKIEKWNIYLVFQCENSISEASKNTVEQDKYSSRKMVWDKLCSSEINNAAYLSNRLLKLSIVESEDSNGLSTPPNLRDQIKEMDKELYKILMSTDKEIDEQAKIYMGEDYYE